MLKKFVVIGGIAAVAGLGIGGVALADSNSSAATGDATVATAQGADAAAPAALTTTTAAGTAKKHGGKHGDLAKRLEKVAHAQWVSKDGKTGAFVTHDAIRGEVTAVSGTSITIKAADGTPETFVVNGSTKVHVKGVKGAAKTPGSIAKVKVGDQAGVLGTGTGSMTATQVIDRGVAGPHQKATAPKAPKTTAPTTTAPTTS